MMKMIFSDFDNTLLDYYSKDNYFDDYKISILKRIQDKGIKFCIVISEFICSLLEEFVKIYPVDDVARSINCLSPEMTRRLVFIKHRSCHFDERPVLPLNNSILLRCVCGRELV